MITKFIVKEEPRLIPFETAHINNIFLREHDSKTFLSTPPEFLDMVRSSDRVYGFTGVIGSRIIACGGVYMIWQGVGYVWGLTSEDVVKYRKWFHSVTIEVLRYCVEILKLHRIETTVIKENITSVRWLQRLGFECEGIMRKYDQYGNDYYLMARVT